jgi:site-specific recombinase XerD
MKEFVVAIYPTKAKVFLATYLHPLTNKRVRANFDSRDEALKYKAQIESQLKRITPNSYRDLPVEELLLLFQQEHPKSEFNTARRMYFADFFETFGQFKIDDLTTDALKTWLDQIQKEANLQDITMRGIKCAADGFFRFLIEKEAISASPLTTVFYKVPVPDVNARNLLSKLEIEELLRGASEYSPGYLYPILKFLIETAAKPMELVDLNWKQIDVEKREVHFVRTLSSQERTLTMSAELASLFEKKKKVSGLVFQTYYKEPFTKAKVARLVNEFKIRGNFKRKWTPMDLRHSFAVNFLLEGGEMKQLQYILGHSHISDTRRLYADVLKTRASNSSSNTFEIGSLT